MKLLAWVSSALSLCGFVDLSIASLLKLDLNCDNSVMYGVETWPHLWQFRDVGCDNSVEAAVARIKVAGEVVQTMVGETLWEVGDEV